MAPVTHLLATRGNFHTYKHSVGRGYTPTRLIQPVLGTFEPDVGDPRPEKLRHMTTPPPLWHLWAVTWKMGEDEMSGKRKRKNIQ
jgi:hypothetical protein